MAQRGNAMCYVMHVRNENEKDHKHALGWRLPHTDELKWNLGSSFVGQTSQPPAASVSFESDAAGAQKKVAASFFFHYIFSGRL